jgi:hypothetical protein
MPVAENRKGKSWPCSSPVARRAGDQAAWIILFALAYLNLNAPIAGFFIGLIDSQARKSGTVNEEQAFGWLA